MVGVLWFRFLSPESCRPTKLPTLSNSSNSGDRLPKIQCTCQLPLWLPRLAGTCFTGFYLQKCSLGERLGAKHRHGNEDETEVRVNISKLFIIQAESGIRVLHDLSVLLGAVISLSSETAEGKEISLYIQLDWMVSWKAALLWLPCITTSKISNLIL